MLRLYFLSGISVKRLIYVVFGSMGMLSALSGILFELGAIATTYVGGVSATVFFDVTTRGKN